MEGISDCCFNINYVGVVNNMKSYTIHEYQAAGCLQYSSLEVTATMLALHTVMGGKVCDTGCSFFDSGRCPAYKSLVRDTKTAISVHTETVRKEATRRGVSIKQVRRERREAQMK